MNPYFSKATKNTDLLDYLDSNVPDDYFDWKIIICFYTALHFINCYAISQGISLPKDHRKRHDCLNPQSMNCTLPLNQKYYDYYFEMYRASRSHRYEAHYSEASQNAVNKMNYAYVRKYIEEFKNYFKSLKVPDF